MYNNQIQIYCQNCKKKISQDNKFCTYCGNKNISDSKSSIIRDSEKSIHDFNNDISEEPNGLITSIFSIILFFLFFVPYICIAIIGPIIDEGVGGFIYSILAGAIIGAFISIPTFISLFLGIIAINKYNKCTQKKSLLRKVLNTINIISLIIIGIIFALFIILLCLLYFL